MKRRDFPFVFSIQGAVRDVRMVCVRGALWGAEIEHLRHVWGGGAPGLPAWKTWRGTGKTQAPGHAAWQGCPTCEQQGRGAR